MNIIDKFKGKKAPETSKVRVTRNCRVKDAEGNMHDALAGAVFDMLKADADYFVGSGSGERILNEKEKAEVARIAGLVPPPHDVRALPENWTKLPKCFASWWSLSERLRALRGRMFEIEAVLLRGCALTAEEQHWLRHDIDAQSAPNALRGRLIDGWLREHPIRILTQSEQQLADQARLRDALRRQGEAIDDFLDQHRPELVALQVEAGNLVLAELARIKKTCHQLADTGFQIFKSRVSALGLEDWKIRELFSGSSDRLRFVHAAPTVENLRFAWQDEETGERVHFLDRGVPQLASLLPRYQSEGERLEKLLTTAKRELRKAQSAAPPEELSLPS